MPREVVGQFMSWIHPLEVVKFRLLSRSFNDCLSTATFCTSNLSKCDDIDWNRSHLDAKYKLAFLEYVLFCGPPLYQEAYARLMGTKLTGRQTIPTELCNLSNLKILQLPCNGLEGVIPPEIGSLTMHNSLTGTIPASIKSLLRLKVLDLSYNQLTGVVPPGIGLLPLLIELNLSNNTIEGTKLENRG
ncbi:hypothetical protein BDR26DRAFT_856700, partial [Obelidium mucronatum]